MSTRQRIRQVLQFLLPIVLLTAGAVAMVGLLASRPEPEPREVLAPTPAIEVHQVVARPRRLVVEGQGTVAPRVRSQLTSRVSGEVVEVSPKLQTGAFFRRGELLLRVDDADYVSALAMRRAELAQAELALALEEKEAAIAAEEWKKLDLAKGEPDPLVLRKPQLTEVRARVAAGEAAVAKAELDLVRTRVVAPYDGQVEERLVDLGRYLTVGTPLARIHGIEEAEVRLPLLDSELAWLDIPRDLVDRGGIFEGPAVRLHAELYGQPREWPARIVRLEGEIDARTQMVTVIARVDDPYRLHAEGGDGVTLPMGLYVRAEIHGRELPQAVAIPRRALHEEDTVYVLATRKGDGGERLVLDLRKVEVLRKQGDEVYVAKGLADGDRIGLTHIEGFVPGMQVRLADRPAAGAAPSNGHGAGDPPAGGDAMDGHGARLPGAGEERR
ncbi:MAG: efflux RND transporter periplasmic adaptor subunit [Planctomycetota bacterium]